MNDSQRKPHRSFGPMDFLWRWIASLVLVIGTYNPSGYSYVHWARGAFGGDGVGALHVFLGMVLLAGWVMFWVATQRSLGTLGTVISALVIGTLIWVLADLGLVSTRSVTAITWLTLVSVATLLAVGLSWAHIWRRLSGQLEVDDD